MGRFRKVTPEEINADSAVDALLLQKLTDNQTFFNSNASGMGYNLEDFNDKQQLLDRFELIGSGEPAGTAVASRSKASASGVGVIEVVGVNQDMLAKDLIPVNPFLGIGGYIVSSAGSSANIYAGVNCYDENGASLGAKYFMVVGSTIGTSWVFHKGQMLGEGTGASQFPVGTRFIKTFVSPRNNVDVFYLDSIGIFPLNFATSALYS